MWFEHKTLVLEGWVDPTYNFLLEKAKHPGFGCSGSSLHRKIKHRALSAHLCNPGGQNVKNR